MHSLPFDKPGRFYKGNLHAHSTNSDGKVPIEEVVSVYREAGYDFFSLTDHFLERYGFPISDTCSLRTGEFTTLLGAELHAPATELGELWHIVAAGLPPDFGPPDADETGPQLARRAREAGAFVGMAHPAWYALTLNDAESLDAAHAVEVYNETASVYNDHGDSWHLCDMLLGRDRRLLAYAADDSHFGDRKDYLGAWVQVRAGSLEPEAILESLKAGHFYSSQGPEILDVKVLPEEIEVRCSPARAVFVTGRGSSVVSEVGDELTTCTLSRAPFEGSYFRVTVVDRAGKRAWTNPVWL
jgi:hypothetical protein